MGQPGIRPRGVRPLRGQSGAEAHAMNRHALKRLRTEIQPFDQRDIRSRHEFKGGGAYCKSGLPGQAAIVDGAQLVQEQQAGVHFQPALRRQAQA